MRASLSVLLIVQSILHDKNRPGQDIMSCVRWRRACTCNTRILSFSRSAERNDYFDKMDLQRKLDVKKITGDAISCT